MTSACAFSNSELYTGDFNGDDRSDIACRRPTGAFEVLFGQPSGALTSGWYAGGVVWCTHANTQLYTGDFDGNGRTDLLCKDPARIQIDYSGPSGTFDFITNVGEQLDTVFCTHTGARLYMGQFNGDARTDLLCVTRTNGDMQVDYAEAGVFPFGTENSHIYVGETPGVPADACHAGDQLFLMDQNADGNSDLYCVKPTTTWGGSTRSSPPWTTPFIRFLDGERYGWSRSVRPRLRSSADLAALPWQRFRPL